MAWSKALLTDFGIQHRLKSCEQLEWQFLFRYGMYCQVLKVLNVGKQEAPVLNIISLKSLQIFKQNSSQLQISEWRSPIFYVRASNSPSGTKYQWRPPSNQHTLDQVVQHTFKSDESQSALKREISR